MGRSRSGAVPWMLPGLVGAGVPPVPTLSSHCAAGTPAPTPSPPRILLQERAGGGGLERARKVIALRVRAAHRAQVSQLLRRLHPLADDREIQARRQRDDGAHDLRLDAIVAHERASE